jgi:hypothetical protein
MTNRPHRRVARSRNGPPAQQRNPAAQDRGHPGEYPQCAETRQSPGALSGHLSRPAPPGVTVDVFLAIGSWFAVDAQDMSERMRLVAQSLTEAPNVDAALRRITQAALETVPGADLVSISVRHHDGRLETLALTDPMAEELDRVQYRLQEGPCYEVVTNGPLSGTADIGSDPRWPKFGREAVARGMRSLLAVRLTGEPVVAALNLYSRRVGGLDEHDGVAEVFATHASIALGYAQQVGSLRTALKSRELIGKAVGIIMERYELNDERAFEFLVRLSSTGNTKLRDIAIEIVDAARQKAALEPTIGNS